MNQNQLLDLYQHFLKCSRVTTDTRKLQKGDIFFALKGDNFDGNLYAAAAIEKGASLAVIDDPKALQDHKPMMLVDNVLHSMQQLGLHHRRQFNIPVIAITGSNGKTTTKELVHAVLSAKFKTYTTQGNLNNHIGIPLTLLSVGLDADMIVVEMGANHQGEIKSYCSYTEPTHGLITNCGKAHLEGFGGIEGVRKGKGELFDYLRQLDGTVFAYADASYFEDMTRGIDDVIWYGQQQGLVKGQILSSSPLLSVNVQFESEAVTIHTQMVGGYNLSNVLAACTIGKTFGVAVADIKNAIENYAPSNIRSQRIEKEGNIYIMDAYNANPSSMAEAIRNMAALEHNHKILLLGAMKEMGNASGEEHLALVKLLQQYAWKEVVLVGKEFEGIPHAYRYFETNFEAKNWWNENKPVDALVLVKGSRGLQMEKVVE